MKLKIHIDGSTVAHKKTQLVKVWLNPEFHNLLILFSKQVVFSVLDKKNPNNNSNISTNHGVIGK